VIFVTVGAQMPFDRLVRAVDDWAASRGTTDVIAQIGETSERPAHIENVAYLDGEAYRRHVDDAELIVAHAGMGTMLTAFEAGRPVLVLPRLGDRGETRNDHQVDTAREFEGFPGVTVAWNEAEVAVKLDALVGPDHATAAPERASDHASNDLLHTLHDFIHGTETVPNTEPTC